MTTRTISQFKTLREILDYNDRMLKEASSQENPTPTVNSDQNALQNRRNYTLKKTSLLSVLNWDAVFSNRKAQSLLTMLVITILSQCVFSYITFTLITLPENLSLFFLSQLINLFTSYIIPLALLSDIENVFESPLEQLSNEVDIYRHLRNSMLVYLFTLTLSGSALLQVLRGGPYIETTYDYRLNRNIEVDLTLFVKILQIISFQLTLINTILCAVNLFIISRKIKYCFNRIERLQNRSDLEMMLNGNVLERQFNNLFF